MHRPLQILCLLIISSVLFPSILAYSQAETQSPAVITFTIDFPTSQPEHYSIRVQSDGSAHYQKPALDEEFKRMEELSRSSELIEVAAIQPILDQIIADQSVINVTRARAQRLLDQARVR